MPPPPATQKRKRPRPPRAAGARRKAPRRLLRWAALGALASGALALAFFLSLPSADPLRRAFPKSTAMMDARAREAAAAGHKLRRAYLPVSLERISPWLSRAVVNSEDARFHLHHGVDLVELRTAVDKALEEGKLGRGASTLTQQLAKNLWLGEERSLWRKAKELLLVRRLEALGKERVLELYLSVVEWGEGVWGAEAAARAHFSMSAAELGPAESAILAAMLPAPRKRSPRHPSARLRSRAAQVLELFGLYRQLPHDELARERERLRALLGGKVAQPRAAPPPRPPEPEGDEADDDDAP